MSSFTPQDPGEPSATDPSPGPYSAFSHLNAPNSELYRGVMAVFVEAKERFQVHLRPEEVHTGLPEATRPATADPVAEALVKLAGWGNLRQDPDTERVTAVEDFYRRRHIYQLTHAGEAVERALDTYDENLGRRGSLQAVALADIATQLRALLELAGRPDPDPAVTYLTLRGLVDRFTDLADNARAFMGSLQRTIDLHDADVEAFLAYKDRLISYLERFIADLITRGAEIAHVLTSSMVRTAPGGWATCCASPPNGRWPTRPPTALTGLPTLADPTRTPTPRTLHGFERPWRPGTAAGRGCVRGSSPHPIAPPSHSGCASARAAPSPSCCGWCR